MSTHCCDPAHRELLERYDRLLERLHDAEARASWAEMNEAVIAGTLARHYDECHLAD